MSNGGTSAFLDKSKFQFDDCISGLNKGPVAISFVQVLEHSLTLEQNTQAWCSNCAKYQQHVSFAQCLL